MKNLLKDTLILFLITLISGLALGAVYALTKVPIQKQEERKKNDAYRAVFEDADTFIEDEDFDSDAASEVLAAETDADYSQTQIDMLTEAFDADGTLLGYVITVTTHAGYGGDITFSMGIRLDGTINGISITSISETPGLGMRASEVLVPQFAQKSASAQFMVTKTGSAYPSEIDAISSATITSNALTNGVNAGAAYFRAIAPEQDSAPHAATLAEGGDR